MAQDTTKIRSEPGGKRLAIPTGGELDVETGGALKIAGITVTASAAEINAMSGGGLSAAELAVLDGVTPGTLTNSKALVVGASGEIDALDVTALSVNGTAVTSTAAELNILDGVTATAAELNILDGVTATAAELNGLDFSALAVDGLQAARVARGTYDFAADGGSQGTINLGAQLPANAIVLRGMIKVVTTCADGVADAATIAVSIEGAGDLVVAIAISDGSNPWDVGIKDIIPDGTAANAVETTIARQLTMTIGGVDLTAGKFHVYIEYFVGS